MTMPRFSRWLLLLLASLSAFAEGTRTWEQSKYDEFEKGTIKGVAIRSDGTLQLAPAFQPVTTTPSTYIWSIAAGVDGTAYVAAGAPARVYRVTRDGQRTVVFEPEELQVQALAVDAKGVVYAATSPDGKVYRVERTSGKKPSATAWSASVFYEPKTKYIWDLALDREGRLYVATGDHGEIFRVDRSGTGSLFFKSDEAHIRRLLIDAQNNVIAGSDGSGLVYRISPQGQAFVLYSAPKKEITALAMDKAGNIYAAGVGEKRATTVSPLGAVPTGGAAAPTPTSVPGLITPPAGTVPTAPPIVLPPAIGPVGSEIYRIAPDGSPSRIWDSKQETVYALGFDAKGRLLAGTGNKGRIFSVLDAHQYTDLLKASATQVTGFARAAEGGLYVSTSNLGKLFLLSDVPASDGTYESDVFDARNFSRWGRAEVRGDGTFELWARSGNVDNPDRNWSAWKQVDLIKAGELNVPSARFVQWKAVLRSGNPAPSINSVILNFLPKNVAPVIDSVTVQSGARFNPVRTVVGEALSATPASSAPTPRLEPTPASVRDHDSVAVRWSAHDDNDDQLVYTLFYRGDGETRWKLLRQGITDKQYSFDANLLPDGGYTIKVVASDARSHSPHEGLSDEQISQHFDVDTTAPQIANLMAAVDSQTSALRVSFRAADGFSAVKRAEYSIDAGEWHYVEPVGGLSDSRTEEYRFAVPLRQVEKQEGAEANEHVVVVRAWDRFENMATAKVVTSAK